MMALPPAWERNAYQRELDTVVVDSGQEGDQAWAILADTVLYPEGGGQPSDRGWLDDTPVLAVRRTPRGVVHVLASPVPRGPVRVRLDWARRYDHMQQHTAQHLLTALAQDRFGWSTTAFHLSERLSDIELDVPSLTHEQLNELEEAAAAEIRAAHPVRTRRVAPEESATLTVRTRGLPEDHQGDVRLVEIDRIDLNTCGGTHVASTAELETIALVGTEPMRGGTRVYFVAGGRVRRLLHEHLRLAAELRSLFGAPNHQLAAAAQAKLDALRNADRAVRRLEEESAAALATALAARPQRLICHHLEGKGLPFLQRAARQFAHLAPASVLLLTSDGPAGAVFCLAAGSQAAVDPAGLAAAFAAATGGRVGGSGALFQGKVSSWAQREAGIAAVARLLGEVSTS